MQIFAQIAFIACLAAAVWFFAKKVSEIRRNILLGLPEDLTDQPEKRWRNLFFLALGQKKMFTNPTVAILHLFLYVGFVIINIEVVEILLDGILGTHRIFLEPLGEIYSVLINSFEVLAALVLIACVIFLIRRNVMKIRRFLSKDLEGWPRSDANYILITEIVLMSLFLTMNATDLQLQQLDPVHYHKTNPFIISSLIAPLFSGLSTTTLVIIERIAWWIHILGIFAFLNYLPWSKHLHILLAFPNAWYARLNPTGTMSNMPSIQKEVLYMMQPELAPSEPGTAPQKFGARDVMDLSWKSLMDAYSCTECGRCSTACPANSTGKLLSPRKIMMSTRDRLEEVGRNINQNKSFKEDGKTLLNDYITIEELRACTTCNACVEACPVSINPLNIILELRRSLIMEDSNAPGEWNAMYSNIENNFAPWKFSPDERDAWTKQMEKA
ncbi:MAG: 4Fe-4S dicluster domain-containing protein [Bacteroidota bacterium]|jgi:ferredoxin